MNLKLSEFVNETRKNWKNQNRETIEHTRQMLQRLALDSDLIHSLSDTKKYDLEKGAELHRDTELGFILLAYSEKQDLYRIPHNHGNAWVVYAVADGIVEMGTYFQMQDRDGKYNLIKKDEYKMKTGDCQVYYPGDIHDTRCVSESVIILRFTSADLREEEKQGRMKRFKSPT